VKRLQFDVPGVPVAKGSAKAFVIRGTNRAVVVQTNRDKQKPWASAITLAAMVATGRQFEGPVTVRITFWMQRPKSHYGTHGDLKARALDELPAKKPDLDKLARCVLDALTGVCWHDDAQVCSLLCSKVYELPPERGVGAFIEVEANAGGEH
jgi:crossover junction endodeoxyribonuclease RusA